MCMLLYPGRPRHVTVTRKQLSVYCRFEKDLLHCSLPAKRKPARGRRVERADREGEREKGKQNHGKRRKKTEGGVMKEGKTNEGEQGKTKSSRKKMSG